MTDLATQIQERLQPIIGMSITVLRRAADMRVIHFGPLSTATVGDENIYSLHIQCAWRIDSPNGILTGRADLWEPADASSDNEPFDYDADANLQDMRLAAVFPCTIDGVLAHPAATVVHAITAEPMGGFTLRFGQHYALHVFPAGSRGEDWRFFAIGSDEHLVIAGGTLEDR